MKKHATKKFMVVLLAMGMIAAGTVTFADQSVYQGFWQNMMGNTTTEGYSNVVGTMGSMMSGYSNSGGLNNGFGHMNGMMGSYNWNNNQDFDSSELLSIDDLKENVEKYLKNYEGKFEIDDIFVYSNSDYYFSIIEEETGRGAMELLVNPVTGYVYPEYGPNMMWNTKYGMHGSSGYGGMMGNFFINNDGEEILTEQEALENANAYLEELNANLVAEEEGHVFYGYYTFHVNDGETLKGMMSVNSSTGDVWYHNWHGLLTEVVSDHE